MKILFRPVDIALTAAMVAAAAFTYKTKHDAEQSLSELRRVEESIRVEQEHIDVLGADWSLLTQPARLQKLTATYAEQLELDAIEPTQIGDFSEIPARPLSIEDLIASDGGGIASSGDEQLTTGGIDR